MRLYLPRFFVRELASNLAALRRDVAQAAELGCGLALWPELFLTGYQGQADPAQAHALFAELSAAHPELMCIFGSLSEQGRNRSSAYLAGRAVAQYDKVHLFEPNLEHELWTPGERYVALRYGGWRIGLCICNDLRFPEQSRALRLRADVNLLVYPALWPGERDHVWAALLRARAIENGCYVAGCCVAGVDNGLELFDGAGNYVFDPLGEPVHPQGRVYELAERRLNDVLVDTKAQWRDVTEMDIL